MDGLIEHLDGSNHENSEAYDDFPISTMFNFLEEAPKVIDCKCKAILTRIDEIRRGLFRLEVEPEEVKKNG